MKNIGFRCFTAPTPAPELTMKQRVANLTDEQRANILSGFVNKIPPKQLDHKILVPLDLIEYMYDGIDNIQIRCAEYLRGEVVDKSAVIDELGNVITPATYKPAPTTSTSLRDTVRPEFSDDFPVSFFANVITEMINWSKWDGTGTFAFYRSQILL